MKRIFSDYTIGGVIGLLIALTTIPYFVFNEGFKGVWGNIVGGCIGAITALVILNRQKSMEKEAEIAKAKKERLHLINYYHSALVITFNDVHQAIAAGYRKNDVFDLSDFEYLKRGAFLEISAEAGRLASFVYSNLTFANTLINKLNEPLRHLNHDTEIEDRILRESYMKKFKSLLDGTVRFQMEFFAVLKDNSTEES